jgi:hypothetical protein
METEYFITKLHELNSNNEKKNKNINEIILKCTQHEEIIENKIKHIIEENKLMLNNLKNFENLFDSIIQEIF